MISVIRILGGTAHWRPCIFAGALFLYRVFFTFCFGTIILGGIFNEHY